MIEPAIEHAIASYKVAHITFYVTPHPDVDDVYNLYSLARGGEARFIDVAYSFEDANQMLAIEIKELETRLEAKRKGSPTTKQIMFLFREKIPIPVDLTWGEASDLIDERLEQVAVERTEREAKRAERFKGFEVGMQVYQHFCLPDGKEQTNRGVITKLTSNNLKDFRCDSYAYVKWSWGRVNRVSISTLKKIE